MWTYDETALGTGTPEERKNAVRLRVGDTNTDDQQIQDEEILFALSQTGTNIYSASAWVCRSIASKYSRYVDTDLDGQLSEKYSQLQAHYKALADTLEYEGKVTSGSIGVKAGGISQATVEVVQSLGDRVIPSFTRDQFLNDRGDYTGYYGDYT